MARRRNRIPELSDPLLDYRLGVQGIGSGAVEGSFEVVSDHANCATGMSDRNTLHCVVDAGDRGTVMVRARKPVAMVVRSDRMRADL